MEIYRGGLGISGRVPILPVQEAGCPGALGRLAWIEQCAELRRERMMCGEFPIASGDSFEIFVRYGASLWRQ